MSAVQASHPTKSNNTTFASTTTISAALATIPYKHLYVGI